MIKKGLGGFWVGTVLMLTLPGWPLSKYTILPVPEVVGVPTIEFIVPSPEFRIAAEDDSPPSVLNFWIMIGFVWVLELPVFS